MKFSIFPIIFLTFSFAAAPSATWAADANKGKELYVSNCTSCHDSKIHTRKDRIVLSYVALKNRVRFCETNAKLNWNDQQVDDVAAYLNDAFYKFKP